ncbi:MAG: hypothetical protein R3F62_14250 [Planctomycetota bacterium]
MVQVDVFWSYALGAGFALAASRQIAEERPRSREEVREGAPAWWQAAPFVKTLLFLALVFGPSGAFLLSAFPSWETMHVARGRDDLPALLVTAFGFTNVTQGILGYWVVRRLVLGGRWKLAQAQWLLGYFCMFFVLVHGWDGTGYVRFFSADPSWIAGWGWSDAARWMISPVALSLGVMGLVLLPLLLGWMASWLHEGRAQPASRSWLAAWVLAGALGIALGSAVLASVCVRLAGWAGGALVFGVLSWALLWRDGGLLWRYGAALLGRAPSAAAPIDALAAPAFSS